MITNPVYRLFRKLLLFRIRETHPQERELMHVTFSAWEGALNTNIPRSGLPSASLGLPWIFTRSALNAAPY